MYVLPMIEGRLAASAPAAGTELQPSADGQTVYDPQMNVTWLANANLAAEMRFNVAGIGADGAMARTTADDFIHNVQPYLYWSCAGAIGRTTCSGAPAAPGFEWSFSFGNGFQGTDVIGNSLYVTVYARDPEAPR